MDKKTVRQNLRSQVREILEKSTFENLKTAFNNASDYEIDEFLKQRVLTKQLDLNTLKFEDAVDMIEEEMGGWISISVYIDEEDDQKKLWDIGKRWITTI